MVGVYFAIFTVAFSLGMAYNSGIAYGVQGYVTGNLTSSVLYIKYCKRMLKMKKLQKKKLIMSFALGLISFVSAAGRGNNSQYIDESFTSNINKIDIDIVSTSIFIETHNSDQIIVEANIENSIYRDPFIVNISNDTLRVSQIEVEYIMFDNLGSGTIIIKVPADSKYDYDMDLAFGNMEMHARGKNVQINTKFNDIELFYPIEKLDIVSLFGSIKATADESSSIFNINSIFGNVYISLLDNIRYTLRGKTSSYGEAVLNLTVDIVFGKRRLTNWQ